jgi:hypothetical protein
MVIEVGSPDAEVELVEVELAEVVGPETVAELLEEVRVVEDEEEELEVVEVLLFCVRMYAEPMSMTIITTTIAIIPARARP